MISLSVCAAHPIPRVFGMAPKRKSKTMKEAMAKKVKAAAKVAPVVSKQSKKKKDNAPKDDDDGHGVRFPPRLRDWLAGKVQWSSSLTQAFSEYSAAFKKKGFPDVHARMEHARRGGVSEKQDMVSKLSLLNTVGDIKAFEQRENTIEERLKVSEGWMSEFEVYELEKIPFVESTADIRSQLLSKLSSKPDATRPGGTAYYYCKKHVQEKIGSKKRTYKMSKEGVVQHTDESNTIKDMEADFEKMGDKAAQRARNSVGAGPELLAIGDGDPDDEPRSQSRGRGSSSGRTGRGGRGGRGRSQHSAIVDSISKMNLTPNQRKKAQQVVDKNVWSKSAKATLSSLVKECEHLDSTKAKVEKGKNAIGSKILTKFQSEARTLIATKNVFKQLEDGNTSRDPSWHCAKPQVSALATAKSKLSDYRKAKDNCLKCLGMIG